MSVRLSTVYIAALLLFACVFSAASVPALAREQHNVPVLTIAVSELPVEAVRTLELIRKGGPYPYTKDGTVFGNRERVLPRRPRGYYTEYTVRTPGARNRGARRIVVGGDPAVRAEFFYTDDHYQSFKRIQD